MPQTNTYRISAEHPGGACHEFQEPFIVPTPNPYVVELCYYQGDEKEIIKSRLIEGCQLLANVFQMLGVSLQEARAADYSLNIDTRDRLHSLAMSKNNMAAGQLILERNW